MILIDTNVVSELIRSLAKPNCAPGQRSCQTESGDLRWRLGRLLQESDIHIHIEQAVPGADATSDVPRDDLHWTAHPSPPYSLPANELDSPSPSLPRPR